ncbi:MAG: hypothetical protein HYZ54_00995 [Ignavibacteriae bacterium]|nr:hypothetical protein [Ignavibacteriota bacterium]
MIQSVNSSPEEILRRKRKRRQAEYIGLTAFQMSFVYMFRYFLHLETAIIIAAAALSLGWLLVVLREKRRILSVGNRTRILTDAVESLLIMFLIAISIIICLKLGIELLVIQAHLCVFLSGYFCGSILSETHWVTNNFGYLSPNERRNYLLNLNSSIIFPYNSEFLRSLLRE